MAGILWVFLSTLPARGATAADPVSLAALGISIHAPREGSDPRAHANRRRSEISIHAPREGSDSVCLAALPPEVDFYPRSPRGERRRPALRLHRPGPISIHAPREGSDRP